MAFPEPNLIISAPDYRRGVKPLVYAWKRADQWLYVGRSHMGQARIYNHNRINKVEPLQNIDEIFVWEFEKASEANFLEAQLISLHQPIYNVGGVRELCRGLETRPCLMCKNEFQPTRFWQKFCSRDCSNGKTKR